MTRIGRQTGTKNHPNVTNVKRLDSLTAKNPERRIKVAKNLFRRGGSYLFMAKDGARQFIISLGAIGLADAQVKADAMRRAIADGQDPKAAMILEREAKAYTLGVAWTAFAASRGTGWKEGSRTAGSWESQLNTYIKPIADIAIGKLTIEHVLSVIGEPLWSEHNVTAKLLRGRLEQVWNAARVKGKCNGQTQNPAQWEGWLSEVGLAKPSKVHRETHHPALPFEDIAGFMAALRAIDSLPARALELAILTGGRANEAREARWSEFDLDKATWRIPSGRMKAGAAHWVPLSAPAVRLLRALPRYSGIDQVFGTPAGLFGKNAMWTLLQSFKRTVVDEHNETQAVTVHGFRSTYLGWAVLGGKYPLVVANMGLAHASDDKVLNAYLRTTGHTVDQERIECMTAWGEYCGG